MLLKYGLETPKMFPLQLNSFPRDMVGRPGDPAADRGGGVF